MGFYRNVSASLETYIFNKLRILALGRLGTIQRWDKKHFNVQLLELQHTDGYMYANNNNHIYNYKAIANIIYKHPFEPSFIYIYPAFDGNGNIQVLLPKSKNAPIIKDIMDLRFAREEYDCYIIANSDSENEWAI